MDPCFHYQEKEDGSMFGRRAGSGIKAASVFGPDYWHPSIKNFPKMSLETLYLDGINTKGGMAFSFFCLNYCT